MGFIVNIRSKYLCLSRDNVSVCERERENESSMLDLIYSALVVFVIIERKRERECFRERLANADSNMLDLMYSALHTHTFSIPALILKHY